MTWRILLCLMLLTTGQQPLHAQTLRDTLEWAINALEYHPESVELRLRKAAVNMQMEQWQVAKDEYDVVLRQQPDNLTALYFRAYANEQLRRYGFARLDYEQLLRLVPGNFEAMLGLALLNQKDRHYTEAADQMNRLVSMYPDSALAYAARAGMEVENGQYELAHYDYTRALDLQPDHADWLLSRAHVLTVLRRNDEARADLDALVRLGTPRSALSAYYDQLNSRKRRPSGRKKKP